MSRLKKFESFVNEEYTKDKGVADAIKKPGTFRKKSKGKKIPKKELDSELAALKKKDKNKKKPGLQLGASGRRKQKQLVLARALKRFK